MNLSSPSRLSWASVLCFGLLTLPAGAQIDWLGTTNGNMSGTGTNWNGGNVPGASDIARWNAATYANAPTANANMPIGQLLFDSGNTAGVTFGTGALTLTLSGVSGVGIQVNSGSGAVSTGSAKFALGASQAWTNNSGSLLTTPGTIATGGFILSVNGSGNTTLGGIISGTGGISKSGSGTLTLSAANTFTTGGVSLNAGTLIMGNAASLGGASSVFTINGGTIDVTASRTTANAQIWNGNFTFVGTSTWSTGAGAITLGGNRQVTVNASTLTVAGIISDGANGYSLTKAGNGAMTLSGNNDFSGGVNHTAGTLNINNAGALGTGTLTIGAGTTINNNSGGAIVNADNNAQNWNGNFTFTGTNSLDLGSGAVTLAAPLTVTTTSATNALSFSGAISGGTIFDIGKAGAGTLAYNGSTTLSGNATANVSAGVLALNGALNSGGFGITVNGAGSLNLSAATSAPTSAFTVNTTSSLVFDSSTAGSTGSTRAASVTLRAGSLGVTGNGTANSVDTISGALTASSPTNYSQGGVNTVTVTSGAMNTQLVAGSLARANNGVFFFRGTNLGQSTVGSATAGQANISFTTSPAAQLIGGGGIAGTQNVSILPWAVGSTAATGAPTSFVTYDANGIRPLAAGEYDTAIPATASTNNVKLNAATPVTATGATTINSLFVNNAASSATVLSGTGALTVTSGAIYADLSLGGNNNVTTISKPINFGTAEGVIGTMGTANSKTLSFTGGISGSGGLTVYDTSASSTQAGVQIGAATTFTGNTVVNGSLILNTLNALPNFANGGRTGDVYVNGNLGLTASARINGLYGNGLVRTPTSGTATLTLGDNNATSTFGGTILQTGALSLTKVGTGTFTFSGTSSHGGATTVSGGTFLVNGSFNGTSAVSVTSAGTLGGSGSIAGATTVTNGTLSPGNSPGVLTFGGNLTLSGNSTNSLFEVASGTRGSNFDGVNVGGLLAYDGNLTLSMTALVANGTYDLFSFTALSDSGDFDSVLFAGGAYSGTFVNSSGTWTATSSGQQFIFTESTGDLIVSAVPEPGAAVLFLGACVAFGALRRRNRNVV